MHRNIVRQNSLTIFWSLLAPSLYSQIWISAKISEKFKNHVERNGYPGICSRYRCRPLPGFGYLSSFCYAYHYGWCPADTPLKKLLWWKDSHIILSINLWASQYRCLAFWGNGFSGTSLCPWWNGFIIGRNRVPQSTGLFFFPKGPGTFQWQWNASIWMPVALTVNL